MEGSKEVVEESKIVLESWQVELCWLLGSCWLVESCWQKHPAFERAAYSSPQVGVIGFCTANSDNPIRQQAAVLASAPNHPATPPRKGLLTHRPASYRRASHKRASIVVQLEATLRQALLCLSWGILAGLLIPSNNPLRAFRPLGKTRPSNVKHLER
jgi:hypothetical protein